MAGPGGGPPRKSHTKSRNGCKTCKRRHIRCDENFPQCRNCTKHNCRCDYMDVAAAQEESVKTQKVPDLLMSPEIEMEIENWHITGVPPFPELLHCPRSGWYGLSRIDLRLIHHIIGLSIDLHRRGFSGCTVWAQKMPNFLAIALSNDFVMSSILALSASHLAWITRNQDTKQLAYHQQGVALKGLQGAISAFSKDNSDAILAASILLSWQATEWQSWASLQQGLSTVLNAMHPIWKQESDLARFLENQRALGSVSPGFQFQEEDMAHLDQTIAALQSVQKRVSHNQEHYRRIEELLDFVQKFRKDLPMQSPEQAFERVQPLRKWLFWLPPAMLRGGDGDIGALAVLAQFYGIGVALDSVFPDMGGAYLGPLSVGPVEDIYRIVMARNAADPFNSDLQLALALTDLPRHIVALYKNRIHWSPRPSIDHYSPTPPSPYHSLQDFSVTSSSPSASPTYAAYTSPVHSPPAVAIASSPFHAGRSYMTASASQSYYPPSPQLLSEPRSARLDFPEFSQSSGLPHSPAFSPAYVDDLLCGGAPRTDGSLGLGMGLYNEPQTFNAGGLVAPELCWT